MTIDLNAIKDNIKTILDTANDTAAAYDLSTGMNTRVQRVLKVNPLKIPIQSSFLPYVTVFTDRKDIAHDTIVKNQKTGKREAEITFTVVGAVWEQITYDIDEDEADEEIERLMENVEEIIRRNYTLSDSVRYCMPTFTEYHNLPLDEETHMRIGQFNLIAKLQY